MFCLNYYLFLLNLTWSFSASLSSSHISLTSKGYFWAILKNWHSYLKIYELNDRKIAFIFVSFYWQVLSIQYENCFSSNLICPQALCDLVLIITTTDDFFRFPGFWALLSSPSWVTPSFAKALLLELFSISQVISSQSGVSKKTFSLNLGRFDQ